jgi:hypothetical protein
MTQEPELVVERDDAAGGRRLELGGERSGGEEEAGETGKDGAQTTHGPRPAGRRRGR